MAQFTSARRRTGCLPQPGREQVREALRNRWFADSSLEGNGIELPVPRERRSGFEASAELRPIDRRHGGIVRAVVSQPAELLRRLAAATTHRRMKAPTLKVVARHRGTEFSNPVLSTERRANFVVERKQRWPKAADVFRRRSEGCAQVWSGSSEFPRRWNLAIRSNRARILRRTSSGSTGGSVRRLCWLRSISRQPSRAFKYTALFGVPIRALLVRWNNTCDHVCKTRERDLMQIYSS